MASPGAPKHDERVPSLHTFEGTATIQNLIVGRDITGVSAFSAGA
jgi:glutaryl-CoA dehydrogenase